MNDILQNMAKRKLYNFKLKGWDGGSSKARKDKEMIYWWKMYSFALNITVIKIM